MNTHGELVVVAFFLIAYLSAGLCVTIVAALVRGGEEPGLHTIWAWPLYTLLALAALVAHCVRAFVEPDKPG